ncbi:MAG: hypothetical protein ACKVU2_01055 [Saprospiraceae bacterium]
MVDLTSNRISHVMNQEALSNIKGNLQGLSSVLSFMVKLSQEEVDALYKISDSDKTFIRNCLTEVPNAATFLPDYFSPEELSKDLTCGDQLLEIENALFELYTNVRRNRMLANSEAYAGAKVLYRLTNAAAVSGNGSAKAMYGRMQAYHVGKKGSGVRNSRLKASAAAQS